MFDSVSDNYLSCVYTRNMWQENKLIWNKTFVEIIYYRESL